MGAAFDQMAMDGHMRIEMEQRSRNLQRLSARIGLLEVVLAGVPPEVLAPPGEAPSDAPPMLMPGTREAQQQTMEPIGEAQWAHGARRADASISAAQAHALSRARAEEEGASLREQIRAAHPAPVDPQSLSGAIAAIAGVPAERPQREVVNHSTHPGVVVGDPEEPGRRVFF